MSFVAEIPVIPSRFDVIGDYRFSKVSPTGSLLQSCCVHIHVITRSCVPAPPPLQVLVGVVYLFVRIVSRLHAQRELLLQGYYSYMYKTHRYTAVYCIAFCKPSLY